MALVRLYILIGLGLGVVQEGWAPHYSKGLMQAVAARRDITPVPCMVSSPVYAVGDWVYVWGRRTGVLRHCKIVDVLHPRDRARHIRTRRWVEISYEVTVALCGSTKGRPTDCPVIVFKLEE